MGSVLSRKYGNTEIIQIIYFSNFFFVKFVTVNYSTNLLEKLIKSEQLNTLVLNLYPSKGYTLGFNIKLTMNNSNITKQTDNEIIKLNQVETNLITYAENELLYYVNSGEIPPIIIDLVDRLNVSLALLLLLSFQIELKLI